MRQEHNVTSEPYFATLPIDDFIAEAHGKIEEFYQDLLDTGFFWILEKSYRAYYGAHSVRSFKRNILGGTGIDPVESSLIGNVEGGEGHRMRWLRRMRMHGMAGD